MTKAAEGSRRRGKTAHIVMRLDGAAVSWRAVDGGIVALQFSDSTYFSLNPTGAAIWRELAEGADEPQLRDLLVRDHGATRGQAEGDVASFLMVLRRRGLLVED